MDVREVDPNELEIDPVNERRENVGPQQNDESLVDSIREQGVIQPPIAREDNGTYKIIVGQRRTLAAQTAGVDRIPVVVVDYDDQEAIAASVTENVDAFKKSVSRTDRAAAVQRLMDMNDWTIREVADYLGVGTGTIDDWLERTRDEWEGTSVHVDSTEDDTSETQTEVESTEEGSNEIDVEFDDVDDKSVSAIRRVTGGGEEGEQMVKKVAEENLSQSQVLEATKRARRGEDLDDVIEEMSQKRQERKGEIRVNVSVTFTGDYGEGLREAAREMGTSEENVVRGAIERYLEEEGYL
ncbi:MAG: ParB/RepB/Spo0J family partition protein [Haloarcula sp.]